MFTVHIKNNQTGETRQWVEQEGSWDDSVRYMWTDGNFNCDCNRAIFFARAGGENGIEAEEIECGEVAYSVPFVVLGDGTKIKVDEGI